MFSGRVVGEDPEWLPEDRDVVAVHREMQAQRHAECGRFAFEYTDELVPDFEVCPFCVDVGEESEKVSASRPHMYGVRWGFYPPREVTDGD